MAISARTIEVLRFVWSYQELHEGRPASLSQIADGLGLTSGLSVAYHRAPLEQAGLLESPSKGKYIATAAGVLFLQQHPPIPRTQDRVLDYLRKHDRPSMGEIAAAIGTTKGLVWWHVKRLVAAGLVRRVVHPVGVYEPVEGG